MSGRGGKMFRYKKTLLFLLVLLTFAATWAVKRFWAEQQMPPRDLEIATGTEGGTYFTAGKLLARLLEEYSGPEIGHVVDAPSPGTIENCRRIESNKADLALAIGPPLANTPDPCRNYVRVLMALYSDTLQLVVRRSLEIKTLDQLKGKRIFVGADASGTKMIATKILAAVELEDPEKDYKRADPTTVRSFVQASSKLQGGELDAAFFVASIRAKAVWDALDHGCCEILDLGDYLELIEAAVPGLTRRYIPAHNYPNQPLGKTTVGSHALLIGHRDLRSEVVQGILNTIFDHIADLAVAGIRVQDARLETAFDEELLSGVALHRGVQKFRDRENEKLLIATGTINGKYYDIGKTIQLLLQQAEIPARVVHSDGSLENLELLRANERPTLAIVQYDTALASTWAGEIYGDPELAKALDIPRVKGLRRIATLHEEKVHILVRREFFDNHPRRASFTTQDLKHPTVGILDRYARVCLGPKDSGAQVIAKAILHHHRVRPREEVHLSVPEMVNRIHNGEIDAGFFVSYIPSEVLKTIVNDESIRLLSVDSGKVVGLLGAALRLDTIEDKYRAQHEGEPAIDTVSTHAALVVREDMEDADVEAITKAILEGEAYLGIKGGGEAMVKELRSLLLHPGAKAAYQKKNLIPRPIPDLDRAMGVWDEVFAVTWRALAILVILVAGYQGFIRFLRDRKSDALSERILAISLEASDPNSVEKLSRIRDEDLLECVVNREWLLGGKLDISRWRYLHELVNDRMKQAKENLTAALADDLRKLAKQKNLTSSERRERLRSLEESAWRYFQKGEMDASHRRLLLEVVEQRLRSDEAQA
jgi:TRAP transporter TAXI family solute receptor